MRGKIRRWLSIALAAALIICIVLHTHASTPADPTPNIDLLDAILYGDRSWVADTLVLDDWSTNPMKQLTGASNTSMAQKAINSYYGIDAESQTAAGIYRSLVDLMEKVYNSGEYANDLTDSFIQSLLDNEGGLLPYALELFVDVTDLEGKVDDILTSGKELRYDRLLKAIYTETYTASNGDTIGDTEQELMWVRQLQDTVSYFKACSELLYQGGNSLVGTADAEALEAEYLNDYAIPFSKAMNDYLSTIKELCEPEDERDYDTMFSVFSDVLAIANYSVMQPAKDCGDFSYTQCLAEYMVDDDVLEVLKLGNKPLEIAETALDSYQYINSIQRQRETIVGPIDRLAASTSNSDLQSSLEYFSFCMSDEYDNRLLSYDTVVNYLRQNDTVSSIGTDAIKSLVKKAAFLSEETMSGALIAKATAIISITSYVADKAVGLKETCNKTYELLNWKTLTTSARSMYHADVAAYEANKTDENAAIVLDDLMMLQRLRLYGEKIAYGISAAQLDSWVGKIFGIASDTEGLDAMYQESVDVIMAASVTPPMQGITVNSGDILNIYYEAGKGYYGKLYKADGGVAYLPEFTLQMAYGLTVNGYLGICSDPSNGYTIGYLETGSSAKVAVLAGTVRMNEFYQKSGAAAMHVADGAAVQQIEHGIFRDFTYVNSQSQALLVRNADVYGTVTGAQLQVTGNLYGGSGCNAAHVDLIGTDTHTISGAFQAGVFRMLGGPVHVAGSLTVTDTLYGPEAEIVNPGNILLSGGTVAGGSYPELLRVQNAYLADTEFQSVLKDLGGTAYAGDVTVRGYYQGQGSASIAENGVLSCQSDAVLSNMTLSGAGRLDLHGDVSLGGLQAEADIRFCGTFSQQVSGTGAVRNITFDNAGSGVTLGDTITVSGILNHAGGTIRQADRLCLIDQATVAADTFLYDLSFGNWTGTKPLTVNGSAYVSGATMSDAELTVKGDYISSAGSILLENCRIGVNGTLEGTPSLQSSQLTLGRLRASASLEIDEASSLLVTGDARCTGTILSDGPLTVRGDCVLADVTATGLQPLQCGGDLAVSGTTSIHHLKLVSSLPQQVTGSFTAAILEVSNPSPAGITFVDDITVTDQYRNENTNVSGGLHIVNHGVVQIPGTKAEWSDVVLEQDTHVAGDLYLTGSLTVQSASLTVDGNLYWSAGDLVLADGQISVNGGLPRTSSASGKLTIDSGSSFFVRGAARLYNLTITLDGLLYLGSDAVTSTAPITGGGTLRLRGDFQPASPITMTGTLEMTGLLRQSFLGSAAVHVGNVRLDNPRGVTLTNTIYYSGTLETGETAVTGLEYLVEEEA